MRWLQLQSVVMLYQINGWSLDGAERDVKYLTDPLTDAGLVYCKGYRLTIPSYAPSQSSVDQAREWLMTTVLLPQVLPNGY